MGYVMFYKKEKILLNQINESLKEYILIYDLNKNTLKYKSKNIERYLYNTPNLYEIFRSILNEKDAKDFVDNLEYRIRLYKNRDKRYSVIYNLSWFKTEKMSNKIEKIEIHSKIYEKNGSLDLVINIIDISPYEKESEKKELLINKLKRSHKELEDIKINLLNQNHQLLEIASLDELTHTFNRYFFNKRLKNELNRLARYQNPLSMVIFDIDNFKKINDTFGHQVGDNVLINICNAINSSIKEPDTFARWGGEEFVILMPNTTAHNAYKASIRLRNIINNLMHEEVGQVTASFGVAQKKEGENSNHWFERLDTLLYRAKHRGKDCIEMEEEGVEDFDPILIWNDSLNSKCKAINKQHKYIFLIINHLHKKYINGVDVEIIKQLMFIVKKHIYYHFDYEEKMLERCKFPYLKRHKEAHNNLKKELEMLFQKFEGEDKDYHDFIYFIQKKLIEEHMQKEDVYYFTYAKNKI